MRSFTIGRAFGIPVRLDVTFLLVLPVFAWLISTQVGLWVDQLNDLFGAGLDAAPLTAGSTPLVLGLVAAVGLFAGVVLHELGHSLVAMRYGFPIDAITLWILGGIAELADQPEDWRQELLIAVAGPAVSVAVGAAAWLVLVAVPLPPAAAFVVGYLALMNLALAAFNMLPGFPMDGGRVLRALLARTRPFARATQIAAEVGKAFALLLGLAGLFGGRLFLVLVAFFIYVGASGEAQRTVMSAAFEDVQVRDVMTPLGELRTVAADTTVAELLETMFRERHTGYPVTRNGEVVGMVTLEDAREVDPVEREAFLVEDVMTTDLKTVAAASNAMEAFDAMQRHDIGRLLVTDGEDVVGLVSRSDIMTAFDVIRNSDAGHPASPASRRPGADRLN
ncbi:MAG: CBS domain-containing protein [Halobacteriaceae archaeon]